MDDEKAEGPAVPLGPPPFTFEPSTTPAVMGPAFSFAFKFLITAIVAGCIGWGVRLWLAGKLGEGFTSGAGWFSAVLVMMAWTWWAAVRSVTTIGNAELRQTWIWTKRMPMADLAYAKLIRVPGLDWLVAPRLYVRTLVGKFNVFYLGNRQLQYEAQRLVDELREFRAMR